MVKGLVVGAVAGALVFASTGLAEAKTIWIQVDAANGNFSAPASGTLMMTADGKFRAGLFVHGSLRTIDRNFTIAWEIHHADPRHPEGDPRREPISADPRDLPDERAVLVGAEGRVA